MMHRIFNPRLFADTAKRLRRPGLISGAVLLISAAAMPLSGILFGGESYGSEFADPLLISPFSGIYMFLCGIWLTLSAFSRCFSREAEDLALAMPDSASARFLSAYAAALLYLVPFSAAAPALSWLLWRAGPLPVSPAALPRMTLYYLSGTLLVSAACALACSLSGRRRDAVVGTFIILLLPGIFAGAGYIFAKYPFPTVQYWKYLDPLFYPLYSVPFGWLLAPLYLLNIPPFGELMQGFEAWRFYPAVGVSFIAAAVCAALALIFFLRRPSEIAGVRPRRGAALAASCALSLAVLLLLPVSARMSELGLWQYISAAPGTAALFFLCAAGVFLLNEFAARGSLRSAWLLAPVFAAGLFSYYPLDLAVSAAEGLTLPAWAVSSVRVYDHALTAPASGRPDISRANEYDLLTQAPLVTDRSAVAQASDWLSRTVAGEETQYQGSRTMVFSVGPLRFVRTFSVYGEPDPAFNRSPAFPRAKEIISITAACGDDCFRSSQAERPELSAPEGSSLRLTQAQLLEIWRVIEEEYPASGVAFSDNPTVVRLTPRGFTGTEYFTGPTAWLSDRTPRALAKLVRMNNESSRADALKAISLLSRPGYGGELQLYVLRQAEYGEKLPVFNTVEASYILFEGRAEGDMGNWPAALRSALTRDFDAEKDMMIFAFLFEDAGALNSGVYFFN